MNKKQFYTVPTVEIIDLGTDRILAASNFKDKDVNISDEITEDDAVMSHKRYSPWSYTWE